MSISMFWLASSQKRRYREISTPSNDKKMQKKRVFRHFWPLDGVEITQKHRFLICSIKLPLFGHLNQNSTPSGT